MSEQFKVQITRKRTRRKLSAAVYHVHAIKSNGSMEFSTMKTLRPLHEWYEETFHDCFDWFALFSRHRSEVVAFSPKSRTPSLSAMDDHYEWSVLIDGPKADDAILQFLLCWDCEKVGF